MKSRQHRWTSYLPPADSCDEPNAIDELTGDLFHQPTLTENDIAEILTLQQHPEEAPYAR